MDEEEQRDDTEYDGDPLYDDLNEDDPEDDPDGGSSLWSILNAMPPGCLVVLMAPVGCLFVAWALIKK